jgi:DNA-binding transcriptional MerR regulator
VEDRAYLSIGEVLSLLKEEFPDVTISKIRFLESQGLLDPERTPSGYRKFYETDVERLRWILRQQREHFLPLKVIKGRLRGGPNGGGEDAGEELSVATVDGSSPSVGGDALGDEPAVMGPGPVPAAATTTTTATAGATSTPSATYGSVPAPVPAAAPAPVGTSGAAPAPATTVGGSSFPGSGGYLELPPLRIEPAGVSLTLAELAAATGLDDELLKELEKFGLLSGRKVASATYYDEDALNVAQLAAGFMKYGVEARHLRMYKTAGEREAGFFEQVVMPMLKQRNPQARKQATEALAELTQLGQGLRAAMLRQLLRHYFEG